ncbi:hypothetical protein IscW_ISCW019285 [Ixodes scapularis]|uniref:Uncharacterized protein n=1 Tax=Ixodes scapularis TaxID=6945 RepID=B7PT68_IXOSC|nr:hypothetical protein IscW_ISCW019285 [Ixodes scapularis]|eukprot:XP_002403939.1 hypothetical protein IscW_ISCW019285 [Ixodes scapularis]
MPDEAGATLPETLPVAPAPKVCSAVDAYTQWSEVTKDPPVSSDSERLVIMEKESPAARDSSLSSLAARSNSVAPMTAGTKKSTNSLDLSDHSDITDPSDNSDPANTRWGQAQDAKRVISSSTSRSPRSRDNDGRRPKKPRPGSRDTSFNSAEDF